MGKVRTGIKISVSLEAFFFPGDIAKLMSKIKDAPTGSNRDVFLTELISNSSHALEEVLRRPVTSPGSGGTPKGLCIDIMTDSRDKTLTIIDNGVGMTREDLIDKLGGWTRPGIAETVQDGLGHSGEMAQSGLGFYSAFLVADEVEVTSKSGAHCQYVWRSSDHYSFTNKAVICCLRLDM